MAGERLDQYIATKLGVSRSRAEKLIRSGEVLVDGKPERKPGARVCKASHVDAQLPPPQAIETQPEAIALDILYEDDAIAIVDKPCGMVVHPAAGNPSGTLVNALLYHLKDLSGIGGALRPGIVHRLDKDTSGLLIVAKTDAAHTALSDALKAREIHKTYKAVAMGLLKEDSGVIQAPIARHPTDRKRMAIVLTGRDARTEYRVVERFRSATLVDVDLITGRTHQIRVHFASLHHPLLGDAIYAPARLRQPALRLMLHAWKIAFAHPITGEWMQFESPIPQAFAEAVASLPR